MSKKLLLRCVEGGWYWNLTAGKLYEGYGIDDAGALHYVVTNDRGKEQHYLSYRFEVAKPVVATKDTNPKDAVGTRKVSMSVLPMGPVMEAAVGMMEGAAKYGRHNYRIAGVRSSVYYDAAMRHLAAWWEGEDIDPDTQELDADGKPVAGTGLSHIVKTITTLIVLRDAQMNGMATDDRPPRSAPFIAPMNGAAAKVLDRYADRNPRHYTIADTKEAQS